VKVSFGFIFLIVGILGIARGGVDTPHPNMGQIIGTDLSVASFITLAAAFFSVGGVLFIKKKSKFSFERSTGRPKA